MKLTKSRLKQLVKEEIKSLNEGYDSSYKETLEYRVAAAISNATEDIFIEEGFSGWAIAASANNVAEYMIDLLRQDQKKYGPPDPEGNQ
jgi:hypothetical protein